ncbi:NUDIX domain-containing protein [Thalassospiraceae bacterium LMO-JJ14]|nr:NUDIX domain-containing protein [Thalassospiraceae bacterium LMO-JJ14]
MKKTPFTKHDVEVMEEKSGYSGFFDLNIYTLRHKKFAGGWTQDITREVFERGHAVAVLPYDPVLNKVLLIEQFRPGAYFSMTSPWFDDDVSPWIYEGIAGIIEEGESPEDVARRESIEEADTPLQDLIKISHYLVSPGGTTESVFVFVGRADLSNVDGIHGIAHEGEDIRPFTLPLEEAYACIEDGQINNGMTIIALQWLMLNTSKVHTEWG